VSPAAAAPAPDVAELEQLLGGAHRLAARLLRSTARIREEDVQVLADAYAGLGGALDVLLPALRTASRLEETFQRFDAIRQRRRAAREDQPARL
jgi:hypothetical protein